TWHTRRTTKPTGYSLNMTPDSLHMTTTDKERRCRGNEHDDRRGFWHGARCGAQARRCSRSGDPRLAEVTPPLVVLSSAHRPAPEIVGQYVRRAHVIAPYRIVGGVDFAVLVVVAANTCRAGLVKLRREVRQVNAIGTRKATEKDMRHGINLRLRRETRGT